MEEDIIKTYSDLKMALTADEQYMKELGNYPTHSNILLGEHKALLRRYTRLLRYDEFFSNVNKKRFLLFAICVRVMRNRLGTKLGILIPNNTCQPGLLLWHYGYIVVNGHAKIGRNCQFHGGNCIGNKGDARIEAPIIGSNVDIGVGAKVIGNVYIADNVKIGANAVVTRSCYDKGAVLVGVPARKIK